MPNPNSYNDEEMRIYTTGVLDACGRLNPSAFCVVTRDARIKESLKATYGGTIERTRWVLSSPGKRVALYRDWAKRTAFRRAEINEEIVRMTDDA